MSFSLVVIFSCFLFSFARSDTTCCYNEDQCEDADISTTDCQCYGYYSCEDANITSTYALNFGAYSNYGCDDDDEFTFSYGLCSNYDSHIETYSFFAYGYLSAYDAEIEPLSNTLFAYFYGYYSGYYADVFCYSGDTCKVFCGSSYGCANLDIYCYSGAYCYYDCANDTSYCPTLHSGVASDVMYITGLNEKEEKKALKYKLHTDLTDDEITQQYIDSKKMKEELKKNDENLEYMMAKLSMHEKNGYMYNGVNSNNNNNENIEMKSLNEHFERVAAKKKHKKITQLNSIKNGNEWKSYGLAMCVNGVALLLLFGLYNMCLKNIVNRKDDVIFDNEDTPFIRNNERVIL